MGVRILHSADWQLGKRFRFIPGDAGALVREQRFATVKSLGELAKARRADLVLVAGDVFEMNTVEDQTLRRTADILASFELPCALIPGNHDPARADSAWSRLRRMGLPGHVHLLLEPGPLHLPELGLCLLPAPLSTRHSSDDLTEYFDSVTTPDDCIRVGLAHGSVRNRLPNASEIHNPISDTRAETAKLDYFALGDWHGALQIAPRTWYAGTPETDRFRDNDAGKALCVDIDGPGAEPRVEVVQTGHYEWKVVEAELRRSEDIDTLEAMLEGLGTEPERQIVSLSLRGTLDLQSRQRLSHELERWAARLRYLRVEEQALHAEPTELDLERIGRNGFVGAALASLLAIANDPAHEEHGSADDAIRLLYAESQTESLS